MPAAADHRRPRRPAQRGRSAARASSTAGQRSAGTRAAGGARTAGRPQARRAAARPSGRRPAPRARRQGRAPARLGRDRLYLLGIAGLLVGLGAMAAGPYADLTAAQGRVADLQSEQARIDQQVEALQTEAQRLQDPAALEEQARSQLGMVRPGEVPYIVVNPPTEDPVADAAAPAPEVPPAPSTWERFTGWVAGWLG